MKSIGPKTINPRQCLQKGLFAAAAEDSQSSVACTTQIMTIIQMDKQSAICSASGSACLKMLVDVHPSSVLTRVSPLRVLRVAVNC